MRGRPHYPLIPPPPQTSLAPPTPAPPADPLYILRRAPPRRSSISPLIVMDQHQGSHTHRYLDHGPERQCPGLFDRLPWQNEGETRQHRTRYPRPKDQGGRNREEDAVDHTSLPDRSALLYQHQQSGDQKHLIVVRGSGYDEDSCGQHQAQREGKSGGVRLLLALPPANTHHGCERQKFDNPAPGNANQVGRYRRRSGVTLIFVNRMPETGNPVRQGTLRSSKPNSHGGRKRHGPAVAAAPVGQGPDCEPTQRQSYELTLDTRRRPH